jgi:hypothetical protein
MPEPNGSTPEAGADAARVGITVLAARGIAVVVILVGGFVGVSIGMRGSHGVMWGGAGVSAVVPAPSRAGLGADAGFDLTGMPASMAAHYRFARANAGAYEQVPCFCGCQDMLGHRNLEDCFVTPDSAWESHASGCQVCIDESQMVMRMMGRGLGPERCTIGS